MQEEIVEGDRNQDSHQILNPLAGHIDVPSPVSFMSTSDNTITQSYTSMNLQHNPASQGQDPPLPRQVDDHQRLIIEPEGFGFNPRQETAKILTSAIGKVFNDAYLTWGKIPQTVRQQIFNEFKTKINNEDKGKIILEAHIERQLQCATIQTTCPLI
uniref:Uncharacterized protein n=1 Tax=Solanum tuberosum TaxID=4113 RepID=M1DY86_SOLTU